MTSGKRSAACVLVLVAAGIGAARFPVSAQGARTDDLLPALLAEMKGLRVAMEQMASGGPQTQLLVGRLQVQETRLTAMIHRLDTVRDNLASARAEYESARDSLQMQEKLDKQFDAASVLSEPDREYMLRAAKADLTSSKARVESLTAEEMQLSGDVAVEQQRWVAINQRLDELERALARR
jgi:hypothetical protein